MSGGFQWTQGFMTRARGDQRSLTYWAPDFNFKTESSYWSPPEVAELCATSCSGLMEKPQFSPECVAVSLASVSELKVIKGAHCSHSIV